MSRGVDRFYRCLAASIDFFDVSRCLATSIDVEVGWAPTRATTTTTTSIDFIDVSRCLAMSIDVDTCIGGWMGADQGDDDDDDDVDRFYRCLATSIDFINVSRCLAMSIDVDTCIGGWMGADQGDDDDDDVDRFYRCLATSIDFIDVARCLATSIDVDTCSRRLWMGADQGDDDDDVDRFYRCLAASIDFFDVSRCLATSIDVDTCRRRGWAQTIGRRRRGRQTSICILCIKVSQVNQRILLSITFWYFSSVSRCIPLLLITRLFSKKWTPIALKNMVRRTFAKVRNDKSWLGSTYIVRMLRNKYYIYLCHVFGTWEARPWYTNSEADMYHVPWVHLLSSELMPPFPVLAFVFLLWDLYGFFAPSAKWPLNTGYITAFDMCEVCTTAVHSVALWTRVTLQL